MSTHCTIDSIYQRTGARFTCRHDLVAKPQGKSLKRTETEDGYEWCLLGIDCWSCRPVVCDVVKVNDWRIHYTVGEGKGVFR